MKYIRLLLSWPLMLTAAIAATIQVGSNQLVSPHLREEKAWAARTRTSLDSVRRIVGEAGLDPKDNFQIENLDVSSLHTRNHVLLATWESGTGHCLSVYILKATTDREYEKVFETDQASDDQNFCSQSTLGAAHAYVNSGKVIVQMPIGSQGGLSGPFQKPKTVDLLCYAFSWNGKVYESNGGTRVRISAGEYRIQKPLCGRVAR